MRIGLSLYSINQEIVEGRMTLETAIQWAADQGAECAELVPFSYTFVKDDGRTDHDTIKKAVTASKTAGIPLVNYSILADLCKTDDAAFEKEVERVKMHVDIAAELGTPRMRHDISAFRRPRGENGVKYFEELFPRMVEAASRISEHAEQYGITTLLENHGFFANGCDRCERLVLAVNRDNYKMLLDTGNIVCVDEDPAVAAKRLAPYCSMIHLKDFYIRRKDPGDTTEFDCAGSWFRSNHGRFLRGSIMGQGDMDMYEILATIKASGYDGDIAIEFEGFEEPKYASRVSLDNAKRIWAEV
ncbi:MAG: sugar phosphate isomerase/epimerase [Clostridiales bacterium]|nr:sugar phosphate isomerase/epimerase [Clostridiales bacterium]